MRKISLVELVKKVNIDITNGKFNNSGGNVNEKYRIAEQILYLAKRINYAYCILVKARSGRQHRLDAYKVSRFKKDIAKNRNLIFKYLKVLYNNEKDN